MSADTEGGAVDAALDADKGDAGHRAGVNDAATVVAEGRAVEAFLCAAGDEAGADDDATIGAEGGAVDATLDACAGDEAGVNDAATVGAEGERQEYRRKGRLRASAFCE